MVLNSCATAQNQRNGLSGAEANSNDSAREIKALVNRIVSWSVWRGPGSGLSWRDINLFSGKDRAYSELQNLFDELYIVGKECPEEVLRQLCVSAGGIELTYAAHWFVSCNPSQYAAVVARMMINADEYVNRSDFAAKSSVGLGQKAAARGLRDFLSYMVHGSAGILKSGNNDLLDALYTLDSDVRYWPEVLSECDKVEAIEMLINRKDESPPNLLSALQYATFGFHLHEWDVPDWQVWWEVTRNAPFDDIITENIIEFFGRNCDAAPGMHIHVWRRWLTLMSVFPLGQVYIEDEGGRAVLFKRLEPSQQTKTGICQRLQDLWDVLKDKSLQQRTAIGLHNAFRILRSKESSSPERAMALYVIKNNIEAPALIGIGIMPLYGDIMPLPAADKLQFLLKWWEAKPELIWKESRRLFRAQ